LITSLENIPNEESNDETTNKYMMPYEESNEEYITPIVPFEASFPMVPTLNKIEENEEDNTIIEYDEDSKNGHLTDENPSETNTQSDPN